MFFGFFLFFVFFSIRPTLEIFLFHLTRPCFSGVGRLDGILFYFYFLRFYIDRNLFLVVLI